MAKIIKNIKVAWSWSGDTYALKGFNIMVLPSGQTPTSGSINAVASARISPENRSYSFNNTTLDTGVTYVAWVQAFYEDGDSQWTNNASFSVADDGLNTLPTKGEATSIATTKADSALSSAQTYASTQATTALNSAKAYADAQLALEEARANAYADGVVDAEEAARLSALSTNLSEAKAYAEAQANSAKTTAINTAAADAATKASTAETNAKNYAITEAKSVNFGYRYATDVVVYGDSDKYYPVIIKGGGQDVKRDILVKRGYYEQAPSDWYTATHKGGLTLKIKTNFGGWGGANYSWEIHELEEMYSRMFAGAATTGNFVMFAIFLRGGGTTGALYHLYSDQSLTANQYYNAPTGNIPPSPQVALNQDLIFYYNNGTEYTSYAPAYRTITQAVEDEIKKRKFIKLAQDTYSTVNTNQTVWGRASNINADGTINTTKLSGTVTDGQIASSSTWNTAKNNVTDMMSDSKVTPLEKQNLKIEYNAIKKEKVQADSLATTYSLTGNATYTTYVSHYNTLIAYLDTIFANMTTTSTITRTTIETNLSNYYDYATRLSALFNSTAKSIADAASSTASTAASNASSAVSTANSATSTANTAASNASAAVSTANSANSKVDNLAIGGRNLLRNTSKPTGYEDLSSGSGSYSSIYADPIKGNVFEMATTGTGETYIWTSRTDRVETSTAYTFSCDLWVNEPVSSVDLFWLSDTDASPQTGSGFVNVTQYSGGVPHTDGVWQRVTWTFTTKANDRTGVIRIDNNGSKVSGTNAIMRVTNLKLEKGNKATDWTPSPEDVEAFANTKADGSTTRDSLDSLSTQVGSALAGLNDKADLAAFNQWVSNVTALDEYAKTVKKGLDAGLIEIENIKTFMTFDIADMQLYYNAINQYMSYSEANGLLLGAKNDSVKLRFRNNIIEFVDGTTQVAYIDNMKMKITQADFTNGLEVGNHKMEKLAGSDEFTVFTWVGSN